MTDADFAAALAAAARAGDLTRAADIAAHYETSRRNAAAQPEPQRRPLTPQQQQYAHNAAFLAQIQEAQNRSGGWVSTPLTPEGER